MRVDACVNNIHIMSQFNGIEFRYSVIGFSKSTLDTRNSLSKDKRYGKNTLIYRKNF